MDYILKHISQIQVYLLIVFITACSVEKRPENSERIAIQVFDKEKNGFEQRLADSVSMVSINEALLDSSRHYVIIHGVSYDTLPRQIFKIKHLQDLSISFTRVNTIPVEICDLSKLESLDLMKNAIQNLDVNILQCLPHLRSINLLGNKLHSIGDLAKVEQLEYLNLSNNNFSRGLGGTLPVNLKELTLVGANLNSFPGEIFALSELENLNLMENPNIKHIPEEIIKLKHLRILTLSETGIPEQEVDAIRDMMSNCTVYYR